MKNEKPSLSHVKAETHVSLRAQLCPAQLCLVSGWEHDSARGEEDACAGVVAESSEDRDTDGTQFGRRVELVLR